MHAFLVTGGNNEWIEKKLGEWNVGKFDRVELTTEEATIGIDRVREFQTKLTLKPYQGDTTVGIIRGAHRLTIEAQNALLKTLEEPPPHARLILESPTADIFLPTVLSRCQLINLGASREYSEDELLLCLQTIEQLIELPIGKRLKKIDELAKNREETATWIDLAIAAAHQRLPGYPVTQLLRSLLQARQHLAANVNYKLVLDNIFLP